MPAKVFVDTGAFIAMADKTDQFHEVAVKCLTRLQRSGQQLITTNFVLDEAYAWIRRKLGHHAAISFGEQVRRSRLLSIVTIDPHIEDRAWQIFKKYKDQDFSYTDCTSFATMERKRVKEAFAFDTHFRAFGFRILPKVEPVLTNVSHHFKRSSEGFKVCRLLAL